MIVKSQGQEPLMSLASKYVQEPGSSDVGIELVKTLAENRYLRKQLEDVRFTILDLICSRGLSLLITTGCLTAYLQHCFVKNQYESCLINFNSWITPDESLESSTNK